MVDCVRVVVEEKASMEEEQVLMLKATARARTVDKQGMCYCQCPQLTGDIMPTSLELCMAFTRG